MRNLQTLIFLQDIFRGWHLRRNDCGATILLAIPLAQELFLNGCADVCAASILAILSAIAIQIRLGMIVFKSNVIKPTSLTSFVVDSWEIITTSTGS